MATYSVSKTIVSPTGPTVIPGENIVYAITITNITNNPTSFVINEVTPGETTFISLKSNTPGAPLNINSVAVPGSTDSFTFQGPIPSQSTIVCLLTVNVNDTAIVGSTIVNRLIVFDVILIPDVFFSTIDRGSTIGGLECIDTQLTYRICGRDKQICHHRQQHWSIRSQECRVDSKN